MENSCVYLKPHDGTMLDLKVTFPCEPLVGDGKNPSSLYMKSFNVDKVRVIRDPH